MNLHEYQAKAVLKKYGVNVPQGIVANTPENAVKAAQKLQTTGTSCYVVKAQIHAGGRGKGGGVKLAKNLDEVRSLAQKMLGMNLITHQTGPEGKKVRQVLITEDTYYPGPSTTKEYYLSILTDREKARHVIMASTEGGVDIETVAKETPEKIIKERIDPVIGLQAFQARKIAFKLGLSNAAFKGMAQLMHNLYQAYVGSDASLIEINPVLKTSDDKIVAVDAKMNIDDNALWRHPDLAALKDPLEEEPLEVEAAQSGLNYIRLSGNVGCMVNGAGLAMATMDIIQLSGGSPANFLDVGGNANAETVENGFRIILKDPHIKAILVNIFGGIVRCDRVAQGIVAAYKNIGHIPVPIIVRLQGTNAKEGSSIIKNSGLKVASAVLLQEAAAQVKETLGH